MNGYDLHRMRLNFRFDNPDKCRSIHSELFMYICDLWNRLGQKKQFGLPTQVTMELLGIGSYNTYTKAYQDLVDWGFIKEIQKSTNQYSARIIAISKIDKATDKALDKASIKATDESTDTIDKQYNKEQINNIYRIIKRGRGKSNLEITIEDNQRLLDQGRTQEIIDNQYSAIENYSKNGKYTSLYLTATQRLKKVEKPKVKQPVQTPDTDPDLLAMFTLPGTR